VLLSWAALYLLSMFRVVKDNVQHTRCPTPHHVRRLKPM